MAGFQSPGVVATDNGKVYVLEPIIFGATLPESAPIGQTFVFNAAASNIKNAVGANGAAQLNAVAGDSFKWFNGAWYWVYHFGTANVVGLSQVHHDNSLIGTGADADNLLKVANPVTAAQVSHIDALYPRQLAVQPAYVAGSTAASPATFRLNDSAGNEIQSTGSFNRVKQIVLSRYGAPSGQNPSAPGTDDRAIDAKELYDKTVARAEVVVIRIQQQGQTAAAASYRVLSATFTDNSDVQNAEDYYTFNLGDAFSVSGAMADGSGQIYNAVIGFNRNVIYAFQMVNMDSVSQLDKDDIHFVNVVNSDGTLYIIGIDAFKDLIQGDNEDVTLAHTFTWGGSIGYYVQEGSNQILITIPSTDTTSAAHLERLLKKRAWARIGNYVVEVRSQYQKSTQGTTVTYSFNRYVLSGTAPSINDVVKITIIGEDIHRGQIARPAFLSEIPNIAGGGGSKGQGYFLDSNGDPAWEDAIPASLVFSELFDRVSVGAGNYTDGNGQLLLSDGNAAPSDAPGATTFILINHNDADGNDQSAAIQAVKNKEWMYVRVADTFVSGRIQYIDKVQDQSGTRFWLIPDETSKHTHAYDTLAAGAAKVGFSNLIPDLNDLVAGTPTNGQAVVWNTANNRPEWGTN